MKLSFMKLSPTAMLPTYAHPDDAGMDVRSNENARIDPGEHKCILTGLSVDVPSGFELQVRPRSGLAARNGITILNTPGTIDAGYHGEIGIILHNTSPKRFHVRKGDRIAQLVIAPVMRAEPHEVKSFERDTLRGAGGFGSTGR